MIGSRSNSEVWLVLLRCISVQIQLRTVEWLIYVQRRRRRLQFFVLRQLGRSGPAQGDLSGGHRAACCVPRTATTSSRSISIFADWESPPPAGFQQFSSICAHARSVNRPSLILFRVFSNKTTYGAVHACSPSAIGMHLTRPYCRFDG